MHPPTNWDKCMLSSLSDTNLISQLMDIKNEDIASSLNNEEMLSQGLFIKNIRNNL